MRLLLDEMFSPVIAEQLRRRGHDVVAVKERLDLIQQSDAVVFAAAQTESRALVTENIRHFRALALSEAGDYSSHTGVIYTTERAFFRGSPGAIGQMVAALDAMLTSEHDISGLEIWLRPV